MPKYISDDTVKQLFGDFDYSDSSKKDGSIIIDSEWIRKNIIAVNLPILGILKCHRYIAKPLTNVLVAIEHDKNHYLIDINDWKQEGGCWVPRHISWNTNKALSRHSWGIAIDLNSRMNPQGHPAEDSRQFELNEYFENEGFMWGNDFSDGMEDPMHWEWGLNNTF